MNEMLFKYFAEDQNKLQVVLTCLRHSLNAQSLFYETNMQIIPFTWVLIQVFASATIFNTLEGVYSFDTEKFCYMCAIYITVTTLVLYFKVRIPA